MEKTGTRRSFACSAALVAILLGGVATGGPALARTQDPDSTAGSASGETETQIRAREVRTNQLLLEALERRRLTIDTSSDDSEARRQAIEFLDSRIALLRSQIEKDLEFFRRGS